MEIDMTNSNFGSFLLGLICLAIVLAVLVWILRWLYVRSSKDRAFVRTGLGGQKVVLDGGALVLPIVHEIIPVNMNTLRIEVILREDRALISKDRMRVDVSAEFFVRVQASVSAVATAAQTLGHKTTHADQLKELIEGRFVDALRTSAAGMSMEDLHEMRGIFMKTVRETVFDDLLKNGLELESVSLTQLDQTGMEFFNPSNTFDAEGLTRLTEQIEHRRKERNDVEQNTLIAIRNKNLEVEKLQLEIDRQSEYARLDQQKEVEVARARQRSELTRERAEQERDAEQVQIGAKQAIDSARLRADQVIEQEKIRKEQDLQTTEISRRTALDLAEQQRQISIAEQSKAQFEAQALADGARAESVAAEERVFTARDLEIAERKKSIELISAAQAGEKEALRLHLAVKAERLAAVDRGEAIKTQALADAEADRIRNLTAKAQAEVAAASATLMNEAHNMLTSEASASLFKQKLLDKMEGIIRESVRPLERIEGIKILNVSGLGGYSSPGPGDSGGATGAGAQALPEQVVNSALRFRAQAPLIDSLLRDIGVDPHRMESTTRTLMDQAPPSSELKP
jgi:uncharacterized membrane protein YqiK